MEEHDKAAKLASRISHEVLSGESMEVVLNALVNILASTVLTIAVERRLYVLADVINLLETTVKDNMPDNALQ
jgi:hypothetical protein